MKAVFKYQLDSNNRRQVIELPGKDAKFLTVQIQHGEPMIWALVYPAQEKVKRDILILGTGEGVNELADMEYLGTYQLHEGTIIHHVFELLS